MKVYERSRQGDRLVVRLEFAQRVAADDLLGLTERAVGDRDFPPGETDARGLREWLEPCAIDEHALPLLLGPTRAAHTWSVIAA
jgi:hypothetical protein